MRLYQALRLSICLGWTFCLLMGSTAPLLAQKSVSVTTLEGFIQAIQSDRTIRLKTNKLNLSELNANRPASNPNVKISRVADGIQLEISNVNNLNIEGAMDRPTKILNKNREAYILVFNNCENLSLNRIEAGHSPAKGACTGGVLLFNNSRNIKISNALLFGDGSEGLRLDGVNKANIENLSIRGCSYGIMTIQQSEDVSFSNCHFTDNREFDLVNVFDSENISFSSCRMDFNQSNHSNQFNHYALINAVLSQGMNTPVVKLEKCIIEDNYCQYFCRSSRAISVKDCKMDNNIFEKGYSSQK